MPALPEVHSFSWWSFICKACPLSRNVFLEEVVVFLSDYLTALPKVHYLGGCGLPFWQHVSSPRSAFLGCCGLPFWQNNNSPISALFEMLWSSILTTWQLTQKFILWEIFVFHSDNMKAVIKVYSKGTFDLPFWKYFGFYKSSFFGRLWSSVRKRDHSPKTIFCGRI